MLTCILGATIKKLEQQNCWLFLQKAFFSKRVLSTRHRKDAVLKSLQFEESFEKFRFHDN